MNAVLRRNSVAIVSLLVLVLSGGSLAWACTRQAHIRELTPEAGHPGTTVTVTAAGFREGPVQIRWGSLNGNPMAEASGPEFSREVQIPQDASPGVYYVVAVQDNGAVYGVDKASAPFEVTGSDDSGAGGSGSGEAGSGSGTTSGGESGGSSGGGSGSATTSGGSGSSSGGGSGSSTTSGGNGSGQGSTSSTASGGPSASYSPPTKARPTVATTKAPEGGTTVLSGGRVFTGSLPAGRTDRSDTATQFQLDPPSVPFGPADSTVTANLWTGMNSVVATSLVPGLSNDRAVGTSDDALVVGVSLLGGGLALLFAVALVAEVRRRRVRAH